MIRSARWLALVLVCSSAACHKGGSSSGGAGDTNTWVAGKVVDADKNPVQGAKVQIVGSDLGSGETDANGIYNIKLLALPAGGEASVKVTVAGFTISQRRFTVVPGGTSSVEVAVKRIETKVDSMVTPVSPPISVSTPDETVQITIPSPAATLGTTGNVSVEVTAGNPKVEREVFPGDFNAVDPVTPAETTGLSSIAFVEVKVTNTDTGAPVSNLTGSATMTVKIPEGTINPATGRAFVVGDLVPVWSFDEKTGLWTRGRSASGGLLFGNIIANPDGSLSGVFPIPHFSWWNMDYPMDRRHCLKGRVVDSGGQPVGNAAVTAFGVDQNYEFGANTGADGTFSFDVFRGTVCRIQAKVGARLTNEIFVNVPDVQSTNRAVESPTNVCTSIGSLLIADGTCVSGVVRNSAGQPVPNALVEVLGRNRFDNSDALGKYCVDGLDPSTAVTLRVTSSVLGLPVSSEIVVTTGATPGRCVDNTCMMQDIVVDTALAGIAGRITRLSDGAPLAGVNVWTDQGPFVRTGADGRYQVPSRKSTPVLVSASFFDVSSGLTYSTNATVIPGTTTAVPGDPATCAPLDLVLDIRNGCVQGVVLNELGVPVQGVNVYASGYPVGSTDASGAYLIDAPLRNGVPVTFTKYVSNGRLVTHTAFVDVTQASPACAILNVTLQFQLACVQGAVLINGLPAEGVTVSTPSGIATATDSFGTYCFDIVRGQDLTLRFFKTLASGQTLWHEQTFTVAAVPGLAIPGSCATGNCTDLGTLTLNRIPVIASITAVQATVLSRATSVVTVTASDPDGDTLSYFWNAPGGTFAAPTVASTVWTAPLVLATTVFPLSVSISDGRGGLQGATVNVTVDPAPNQAPVISSLTAGSPGVLASGSTSLTAAATDPNGDAIVYSWSATGGTVVGAGPVVTWQAPSAVGSYTITVTASDGNASSSRSVGINVTPTPNRAPVIASLSASPSSVGRNGVSTATVNASDPDGNPLTFLWSAGGGASVAGSGNTAVVTAPPGLGGFQVSVLVSDGLLSASANVTITVVNNPPVISLLNATPSLLVGGASTVLTSAAGDPDGDPISYVYTQTAGPAAGAFTGTGPSRTWTAPGTVGLYTLQLAVSDGLLSDTDTVNITVGNRPPQISAISATPSSVGRGGSTSLAVTASDPDGDTLSYAWSQTSGPPASTILAPSAATTGVTMPATEGTYTFRVVVTDNGAPPLNVQATVNVVVGNRAPVVSAMTATPTSVGLSGTSTIAVTAADPDGDAITYAYSATGGTIPGTTASETWTGPAVSATYTITVTVSDGALSTQATVQVTVAPDTTPPTVVSVAPLNAASNVALASTVVLTFSEAINPATVTAATFTVSGVAGTISFSAGNTVATFTPGAALTGTTTYTVTATTGVQDANGNALAAPFTSTFTTVTVTPTISITDVTTLEGNAGSTNAVFNVTLSQSTGATVTVSALTADGTATSGADYTTTGPTTLTFLAGETLKTFTVPVLGDLSDEPNEGYVVNLTAPTNATILDGQGDGSITDDDGASALSIADVTVTEGDAGTVNAVFTVTLAPSSGLTVTVRADTADGTAASPSDYAAVVNQTLTFLPGETTKTVTVVVSGDTTFEAGETFVVNLTNEVNATVADAQAVGTISNDDGTPTIAIGDVTTAETGSAGFTVTLSNPSQSTITVQVDTAPSTAASPGDYTAVVAQTLTFNPGETSKPLAVTVAVDTLNEDDETFFVDLSSPSGATIADPQAVGTITNDDAVPTLSIDDVAAAEAGTLTFTVTLSAASGKTVTVTAGTANDVATSPADYAAVAPAVLSFAPGETTKSVVVTSAADALNEADETFFVNLTLPGNATIADAQGVGTINDDDPLPTLSINDVGAAEGDAGTSILTFTVSLSGASGRTITVSAQTADNTATTADADYVAAGPTVLTFLAGETTKNVLVTVNGDVVPEAHETFTVGLSGESNATIADASGAGTITNDDASPISITSLSLYSGPVGAVVRVNGTNFDPVPANNVVRFNGTGGPVDGASTTSLLVRVPPGATTGPVTVQVGAPTSPPSDPFTVLAPPASFNTTLSVSKALSERRHAFPVVRGGDGEPDNILFGNAFTNHPLHDRYLLGTGQVINVYNTSDGSLVASLDHSLTDDELIFDIAVTPDGKKAYAAIFGPLDTAVGTLGHSVQVVTNLDTVPVLGPRIDLQTFSPLINTPEAIVATPDGTKILVVTSSPQNVGTSGHVVVINPATDTVASAIVLPDPGVGNKRGAEWVRIHPRGSHAYIKVRDEEVATTNFLGGRIVVYDINANTFPGGDLVPGATEDFWCLSIHPSGLNGILLRRNPGVNTLGMVEVNLFSPASPSLGAVTVLDGFIDAQNDVEGIFSPDGGMMYVKGQIVGEEKTPTGEAANHFMRGYDVRNVTSPVLFDEVYLGGNEFLVEKLLKWHYLGTRFLAINPGIGNPAQPVQQDSTAHLMRVFPGGAQADLPPFKGGPSGGPLAGGTLTVNVFDDITALPLPGVSVSLSSDAGAVTASGTTDVDGNAAFPGLTGAQNITIAPAGRANITLFGVNAQNVKIPAVSDDGGPERPTLTVVMNGIPVGEYIQGIESSIGGGGDDNVFPTTGDNVRTAHLAPNEKFSVGLHSGGALGPPAYRARRHFARALPGANLFWSANIAAEPNTHTIAGTLVFPTDIPNGFDATPGNFGGSTTSVFPDEQGNAGSGIQNGGAARATGTSIPYGPSGYVVPAGTSNVRFGLDIRDQDGPFGAGLDPRVAAQRSEYRATLNLGAAPSTSLTGQALTLMNAPFVINVAGTAVGSGSGIFFATDTTPTVVFRDVLQAGGFTGRYDIDLGQQRPGGSRKVWHFVVSSQDPVRVNAGQVTFTMPDLPAAAAAESFASASNRPVGMEVTAADFGAGFIFNAWEFGSIRGDGGLELRNSRCRTGYIQGAAVGTHTLSAASMQTPRYNFAVEPVAGNVLYVGGKSGGPALNTGEIYNAAADTTDFTRDGGLAQTVMSAGRNETRAVTIAGGLIVIVSGDDGTPGHSVTADVFNPATGLYVASTVPNMAVGRIGHHAVVLNDGRVLVVGGLTGPFGSETTVPELDIYNPGTNNFTTFNAGGGDTNGSLTARDGLDLRVINPGGGFPTLVLATGGRMATVGFTFNSAQVSGTAVVITIPNGGAPVIGPALPMRVARVGHHSVRISGNDILLFGGVTAENPVEEPLDVTATVERFEQATSTFFDMPPFLHARAGLRVNNTTVLGVPKVIVVGGSDREGPISLIEIYDPSTGVVDAVGDLKVGRDGPKTMVIPRPGAPASDRIVILGGRDEQDNPVGSIEYFDPD